jgi:ABC-2 type transport system permease protein
MNYFKQVLTVTLWEYRRFFKLKNELLGIVIMIFISTLSYFGGKYAVSKSSERPALTVMEDLDPLLVKMLSETFEIQTIPPQEKEKYLQQIATTKEGQLLLIDGNGFVIHSWKKPGNLKKLREILNADHQVQTMQKIGLSKENIKYVLSPVNLESKYFYEAGTRGKSILAYFFAGLMIMAVFLSFAYQFMAITGEKQLKITELIVSAIKPQVWMDGKILGITLTGLSSMLTYSIIGTLGGILFLQFTGASITNILQFLHLPSILLFFVFTLMGILIWNAFLAATASIITDPNNSGKSSLMLLPVLFVVASFLVMRDPDNKVSVFLSWFPLTSATAMPMRWVATEVEWWHLAGSFSVLAATFYLLRKLAARIFRVSILISGKEPTWREIIKLARED